MIALRIYSQFIICSFLSPSGIRVLKPVTGPYVPKGKYKEEECYAQKDNITHMQYLMERPSI